MVDEPMCSVGLALVGLAACAGGSPHAPSEPAPATHTASAQPLASSAPAPEATASVTATSSVSDAAPGATDAAAEPVSALPVEPGCVVGRKHGGATLSQIVEARRCLAPAEKWIKPYSANAFSFSADPPSLSVQRGAHADLFVQIEARRDAVLQLELGCLDEPVTTMVYDAHGKRVDETGDLPAMICQREVLQVFVRGGDGASLNVPFVARRHVWKNDSRTDAGPLAAGSFELRLQLPIEGARTLSVPLEVTR